MTHFDLLTSPLEGRNLIEASAGTGKTYTIAGLYLRLLLEKHLSVDQILVVTFTVAATEELRDRIRQRIRQALAAFAGQENNDKFLAGLVKKVGNSRLSLTLLNDALYCLDEAAVFTIHGFCQRVLQDKAFECSLLFDTELISDQSALVQDVVDDFWRIHICQASEMFISFLKTKKLTPESLASFVSSSLAKPNLRIIPECDELTPPRELEEATIKVFDQLRTIWPKQRDQVAELLSAGQELNRKQYSPNSISHLIEEMDQCLATGNPFACYENKKRDKLEKFCSSSLNKAVKKGGQPPQNQVFILTEKLFSCLSKLETAYKQQLVALKRRLLAFVRQELDKRKKERNIRSFDDLLSSLQAALERDQGKSLAKEIREKYRAALIDEFQDTDPIQYAIFKAIYPDQESILFLIGDPKQAIYSFRGADIFAYLEAAKNVEARYTLGTSWRSSPGLIKAVNSLFSSRNNPFIFHEIPFYPVDPPPEEEGGGARGGLTFGGQPDSEPLQIWFLSGDDHSGTISREDAEKKLTEAVASEIIRLLKAGQVGEALIEGRPVACGDIAVLVRTNQQASRLQEALRKRNIPSVLYSSESLFASREAADLLQVMTAVAEPNQEEKIRAALVTELIGKSGNELARLIEDTTAWGEVLDEFRLYHELWLRPRQGFMIMAAALMARRGIKSRLLAYPDGERRLTNLLHCLEVLHQMALENGFGIDGLLKWFARQINERPEKEEYQIRLETDELAVKLVTIHRSKGLEYPIVFCPYTWYTYGGRQDGEDKPAFFHDPENGWQPTLVLNPQDQERAKSLAEQEALAENLRLLYVALTRAKYRCYLAWGKIKATEASALAYLFHAGKDDDGSDPIKATVARISSLDERSMLDELNSLAQKAHKTIRVCPLPAPSSESYQAPALQVEKLSCRTFSGTIANDWRIASFSSLVSGKEEEHWDRPGRDESHDLPPSGIQKNDREIESLDQALLSASDFPAGAKAGTCLHEILEHLDFSEKNSESNHHIISERLSFHGFDQTLAPSVSSLLDRVLATPLIEGRPDFTLSALSSSERLEEMDFYFPLERITCRGLGEIFSTWGGSELIREFGSLLEKLDQHSPGHAPWAGEDKSFTIRGLLKGYIDLVFRFDGRYFLVDYKSNYLGPRLEDYSPAALAEVMKREYYILQYHIYTLALHKYLAQRIQNYSYQKYFGGVFYIFLRGMNPVWGPRFGVYQDRPPEALINALNHYLCGYKAEREEWND